MKEVNRKIIKSTIALLDSMILGGEQHSFVSKDAVKKSYEILSNLDSDISPIIESRQPQMPEGYEVYECTDCQYVNAKKNNGEIRVGFCDECEHPLWNPA